MAAYFRGEVPRMFFFFIRSFIEDPSDATSGFAADPGSPVTEGFAADPGSPVTEGFAADPGSPVTAGFADASGFCRYFRTLPGSCVFAGPAPFRTVSGSPETASEIEDVFRRLFQDKSGEIEFFFQE